MKEEVAMLTLGELEGKPAAIEPGREYYSLHKRSEETMTHDASYKYVVSTFKKGALHHSPFCEISQVINQSWIIDI